MKLLKFLTPRAQVDLQKIYIYTFEKFGLDQADIYSVKIEKAVTAVIDNPHIGRDRSEVRDGYSSFPVRQHVLWYRQIEGRIEIMRILHGAMDPERQL
jgi:toxin ParE1/3/4